MWRWCHIWKTVTAPISDGLLQKFRRRNFCFGYFGSKCDDVVAFENGRRRPFWSGFFQMSWRQDIWIYKNQILIEFGFKSDAGVAFQSFPPAGKIDFQDDISKVTTSLLFQNSWRQEFWKFRRHLRTGYFYVFFENERYRPFCRARIAKVGNS